MFSYFSEMSTNRVFSAIKCRRIRQIFAIKIHRNISVITSTVTNSRCLRIGTKVVSIRRHQRIGLSTNRDKCGVDSSTSTNRDVYQCGYLRIDLLPLKRRRLCRLTASWIVFQQNLKELQPHILLIVDSDTPLNASRFSA